ncbi:MAG: Crp/Fnr family transcriptional regulator [Pseudomonadota bacterium]
MKFTGVNLLDELKRDELGDLHDIFNERSWPAGAVIFDADETDNLVFIIAEGRVRIYLAYEDKEFTLGILGPGDLYATHAGCYVQAFDDARLLAADVHAVKRCMTEVPAFTRTMVRVLGNILQNTFSIIGGLAFKDIYDRLMDYILIQARDNGVEEDGGLVITLGLTVEQLAQLLGATRQTVSTLLNDMVRAGLLEKRGRGRFYIPELAALERAAAG